MRIPACLAALLMLGSAATTHGDPPQESLSVLPDRVVGLPREQMMHAWLMDRVEAACDRSDAEYEKLKTPGQLAAYQARMRDYFWRQLGELPAHCPLAPQVVGTIHAEGFRIEKVIFQSQPRHYVTALLYIPAGRAPFPGVLVPCGHSLNGKAMDVYQRACLLLVRNGFVVLCYDPIDQGERMQLLDAQGKTRAASTIGHCRVGVGSILLGRNAATFRIWDGIRALDYLQSRPEVDPQRIGCTGNSGGGTLTSYLMALDPRIVCAAPSCYLTSMRRLLETIGPQDSEQDIFGQVAFGLGHAEYVLMRAPKPTLMCTATHDFFDIGGAWETYRKAKRFYGRMGVPERVDLVETDEKHGFSTQLRVGAVRWMRRWLLGVDDAIEESSWPVLSDAEARCTPEGQVMRLPGARSVYDLNIELERKYAGIRRTLWQGDRGTALAKVRALTGIRRMEEIGVPEAERTGSVAREGYRIEKLVLRPRDGVLLPALWFVPAAAPSQTVLYVHGMGKQADAGVGGPIEQLVRAGKAVLAVDLRGLGETQVTAKSSYGAFLGPDWIDVYLAYLLGRSYVAYRAEDVLACASWLRQSADAGRPTQVELMAQGMAGPAALHAAALEPQLFGKVRLAQTLRSWVSVVETPMTVNEFANVVHGALAVYDLTDLAAALPAGQLELVEPRDKPEVAP